MNFHDELKIGSERELLGPVGILIRLPCKEFVQGFVVRKLSVIFEHGKYIGLYNMNLCREDY